MDSLLLAEIALGVAGLAVVLAVVSVVLLRKARRQLAQLHSSAGELDMVTITTAHADQIEDLRRSVGRLGRKVDEVQAEVATSLRHLAVVRFNALSEVGGRFSFSVALLDDNANGIVLTSIQGTNQARIYAKAIFESACDVPLSPEEEQAIEAARPKELR